MTVVDFHNHFYPPAYLDALKAGDSSVRYSEDAQGNPVLHYPGDYNVAVRGHRDIAYREEVLAKEGVNLQVLTFTTPGVHVEEDERAVRLARLVNDAYAVIVRERGARFSALATLPLSDPAAAERELCRAMDELGLPGACVFSNVNGVALADGRHEPLWKAADRRNAVVFIHPTYPVGVEAMTDYWLMPLLGFPFDTSLAIAKLVFSGAVERHPRIRWVLGHLGGTIPYLAERLDRGWKAFAECRVHIGKPPSEYLKTMYYDTVNFDRGALRLAIGFAGAAHIVAGSDYPHMIGSIPRMLEAVRGLGLAKQDEEGILGSNALGLLKEVRREPGG